MTATSRRLHVVTLQRCDVSSRSAPYHLKYEWFRNQGIKSVRTKARNSRAEESDGDLEEVLGLRIVSHFLWIQNNVFHTKHFHRFIHYVLDLFLGLHRTLSYVMD